MKAIFYVLALVAIGAAAFFSFKNVAKFNDQRAVKVEFVEGGAVVETPTQNVERRSAESIDAARRSLEEDPTVREMQTRFGATLHPESVRPIE
jgi:hypothetical protein